MPLGSTALLVTAYGGQDGRQLFGVWKGTITFTGEHRYATVRTHEAPGTVILKPASAADPTCGQATTVTPPISLAHSGTDA